jgi:hypothetical protein
MGVVLIAWGLTLSLVGILGIDLSCAKIISQARNSHHARL